jgi:F-type H+-transporting ATPase subunit delta
VEFSGGDINISGQANVQASLSGRYASALFDLARDTKSIDTVEASLSLIAKALDTSPDLKALTLNPLVGRDAASKAMAAVTKAMKLDKLTTNFVGVLANNRRLDQIDAVIASFATLAASHRGEISAQVTSAHPLSAAQVKALSAKLQAKAGQNVRITQNVDPEILGGLIIKIGSQMIDSSIKTRLNALASVMKG